MKTALCPISDKRINENIARGNAFITVIFLVAYVFTASPFVILFLLFDVLLRGLELASYSPVAILSAKINQLLAVKPKIINAGPKIFSARIGAIFSFLIVVSALSGWEAVAWTITTIFGICAFLEAVFAFCVACEIYPYVYRLFYQKWFYKELIVVF